VTKQQLVWKTTVNMGGDVCGVSTHLYNVPMSHADTVYLRKDKITNFLCYVMLLFTVR